MMEFLVLLLICLGQVCTSVAQQDDTCSGDLSSLGPLNITSPINQSIFDRYENANITVDCIGIGVAFVTWRTENNDTVTFDNETDGDYQECMGTDTYGNTTVRLHLRGNVSNGVFMKNYSCEANRTSGARSSVEIMHRINVPVTLTNTSESTLTRCFDQSVTFYCEFRAQPVPLSITWDDVTSNSILNGDLTTTFTKIDSLTTSQAGNYTCEAFNEDWDGMKNHSTSSTFQLFVRGDLPVNATATSDDAICTIQWEGRNPSYVIGYVISISYDDITALINLDDANFTKFEWLMTKQDTVHNVSIALKMDPACVGPFVTPQGNCSYVIIETPPTSLPGSPGLSGCELAVAIAVPVGVLVIVAAVALGSFCYFRRSKSEVKPPRKVAIKNEYVDPNKQKNEKKLTSVTAPRNSYETNITARTVHSSDENVYHNVIPANPNAIDRQVSRASSFDNDDDEIYDEPAGPQQERGRENPIGSSQNDVYEEPAPKPIPKNNQRSATAQLQQAHDNHGYDSDTYEEPNNWSQTQTLPVNMRPPDEYEITIAPHQQHFSVNAHSSWERDRKQHRR